MKKYDSYKDSGVEWIGEIPSHWEIKRFKSLFIEHSGNGFPHEFQGNETGDIPFYKVSSLNGDGQFVEHSNNYVSMDNVLKMKWNIVPANTILTAKIGESLRKNHRKISKTPSIIDNNCLGIESKMIDKKLAFYMLKIIDFDLFTNPGAVPSVSMEKLRYHIFPITNEKEEQSAIANYLDHKTTQIDHLIAKKEQFIQLLEEERVAVINQAVTKGLDPSVPMKDSGIEWLGEIPEHWEVKKLKQIFNSSKGLTITKENLEIEGIPCINYGEIHSKFGFEVDIDKHQLKCVNPSYLESDYKSLIQTGDFVFADTSEDVNGAGNFTYLKSNHEIFAGYHTIILRTLVDIESRYFAYQFDSIPYRTQIRQSVKGIKVFSITQGILKNTSLWIPPIDEQKQIIEFLDIETNRIVRLKNSAVKEIELLKEFKTSLISEVVTGKVDVRNKKTN